MCVHERHAHLPLFSLCDISSFFTKKKKKKKQVIAIGKKTGCDVELHPVEIIYSTPSILLFCRYANALRTLPDPLGRQHLKRSRRGAVLFVQHHLLDSVVGRRLGRLGVFQLVFVHRLPTLSSSLEQCGRNTECTDYNTSITPGASAPPANRQDATVVSKIARSFPQHTPFYLSNYLSLLLLLFSTTFLQPL